MDNSTDYTHLVKQAQLGDRESLESLSALVRKQLYAYVYRIVMDNDKAQDIVQESLLEMIKVVEKLEDADKFWPWLRGIAYNMMCHYFRKEKRGNMVSISSISGEDWLEGPQQNSQTVFENLMSEDLRKIVFIAMAQLRPQYRAVLSMRCYEEMKYSEIAKLMKRSELSIRVLFYRAKQSMRLKLSNAGIGKAFLLSALGLFGRLTAPSEAAAASISVTASTAKVGVVANVIGLAQSKVVLTALIISCLLSFFSILLPLRADDSLSWASDKITIVRNKIQSGFRTTRSNEGIEEYWYYYPENTTDSVMIRMMKMRPGNRGGYCLNLQNDEANYIFDKASGTVHIVNHRYWKSDLSIWRLPCDNSALREFLSTIDGSESDIDYDRSVDNTVIVVREKELNRKLVRTAHQYNVCDEEYFQYGWPAGTKQIDKRDTMHKRGWTCFTITGQINGKKITGSGRLPFVYSTSKQYNAWVRFRLEDGTTIADNFKDASIGDPTGKEVTRYKGGSFFAGLGRPWMGLHTIDTVRRDAAQERLFFTTKYQPGDVEAEVEIENRNDTMLYIIDMDKDIIKKIVFSTNENIKGELIFSYLEEVEETGTEFVEPTLTKTGIIINESRGMLWLMDLAKGTVN